MMENNTILRQKFYNALFSATPSGVSVEIEALESIVVNGKQ